MTTAPASQPTTADSGQPQTDAGATDTEDLTRTQKLLIGIVAGAVLVIATLGFIGSYAAVTTLATAKGFGDFAHAFPIAVDAGIIAFLALDLLLTWRRIPYPLLRYSAWGLTIATICFNAAVAWPDWLGVSMHAVIPILFVIAVEAARHAVGRLADITADRHIESPPVSRWLLDPYGTFRIWRRQRMWQLRSYEDVINLERDAAKYRQKLRAVHGRKWRSKAQVHQVLALRFAKYGTPIADSLAEHAAEVAASAGVAPRTQSAKDSAYADVADTLSRSATPTPPALEAPRSATPAFAAAATKPSGVRVALPATTDTATRSATESAATPTPDRSATPSAATPQTTTPRSATAATTVAPTATPSSATKTTSSATTPTPRGDAPYETGTAKQIVHTLWTTTGQTPGGPAIVAALGNAGLPNSPQQARKIRALVGKENPNLPGVRAAA